MKPKFLVVYQALQMTADTAGSADQYQQRVRVAQGILEDFLKAGHSALMRDFSSNSQPIRNQLDAATSLVVLIGGGAAEELVILKEGIPVVSVVPKVPIGNGEVQQTTSAFTAIATTDTVVETATEIIRRFQESCRVRNLVSQPAPAAS